MEPIHYEKRGYLNEPFRLFHLADSTGGLPDYHFHNFHKLVFLLAGKAGYDIEGEHFALSPGDFVLVSSGCIHRPEVESGTFYERMILYISPEFLQESAEADCDPEQCFLDARTDFHYVFRAGPEISALLHRLEACCGDREYGCELLKKAVFLELMVEINRTVREKDSVLAAGGDRKLVAVLQYLNLHLFEPLTVEELADRFYISKYHLMRRFKESTGYTIHGYLTEKRLLLARQLLRRGENASVVAAHCGYRDYSTFLRAYRKQFGCAPTDKAEEE